MCPYSERRSKEKRGIGKGNGTVVGEEKVLPFDHRECTAIIHAIGGGSRRPIEVILPANITS